MIKLVYFDPPPPFRKFPPGPLNLLTDIKMLNTGLTVLHICQALETA